MYFAYQNYTLRPRQLAALSLMTVSNKFICVKMGVFNLKFHMKLLTHVPVIAFLLIWLREQCPTFNAMMNLEWSSRILPGVWHENDDVIKWKYFPRYWPFVRGIHRSPMKSPNKGLWRGALMFPLICAWINSWVNNRKAGDLRHLLDHYDVSVMIATPDTALPECTILISMQL